MRSFFIRPIEYVDAQRVVPDHQTIFLHHDYVYFQARTFRCVELVVSATGAFFIETIEIIANAHPNGRVLVVTHNTLISLALCSLFGIPLARYRAIFPEVINCALTEILFRDKEVAFFVTTQTSPQS